MCARSISLHNVRNCFHLRENRVTSGCHNSRHSRCFGCAAYQFRLAKEKEAEARLFTEKQKVYSNLISTIFSIYQPEALKQKQPKDIEYARKFNEIRTSLIVWGSFETIKCLDSLSMSDAELQLDPLKWGLKRQAALFAAIRKDLGHKDPDDAGLEIAIGAIKGAERAEVRTKILK